MLSKLDRFFFFISSYLPLYIWLLLTSLFAVLSKFKTVGKIELSTAVALIILFLLIIASANSLIKIIKADGKKRFRIPHKIKLKPMSDSFMNYIVTYFTPIMSFDIFNIKNMIMNLCLFILIGFLYLGSNALHLNPVLGIIGFKLYEVEGVPNAHHIITKLPYSQLSNEVKLAEKSSPAILWSYKISDGILLIKNK